MKFSFSILICLLFACTTPEEKIPENILSETKFELLLKEIHLAEAAFELNKSKGIEQAQNTLANSYRNIYTEKEITEEEFKITLEYYSNHPEKLEKIYTHILEQLTKERSILNQQ